MLIFFALGLLIGSFLNVAAIRTLNKQSVAYPPSHCVHCRHPLKSLDLVPVLSYIGLRGRCRYCRQPISWRYPAGELATGLLFVVAYAVVGLRWELVAALFFICILVVITQTDLEQMIIPNSVVLVGLAGGLLIRVFVHPYPLWDHVIAVCIGSGLLFALGYFFQKFLKKEAMGGGDIKLYAFIGLMLGVQLTMLSLFAASLFGLAYGIFRIATVGRMAGAEPIPFGPFIAAGSLASYLWGEQLINLYMQLYN